MQTPRGALAPEFRSSGRPTKWGDRQQHRSDWDDSPAAVRTLAGTLRKLVVSLATRRGGRCLAGWLGVPLACSSAGACFLGVRGAAGRIRCGLGGLLAKGRGRVPALLLQPPGSRPYCCTSYLPVAIASALAAPDHRALIPNILLDRARPVARTNPAALARPARRRAPAQLQRALARSSKFRACSGRAGFWVTMCFYGHVKSSDTFWGHLGPFASSGEHSLARARRSSP